MGLYGPNVPDQDLVAPPEGELRATVPATSARHAGNALLKDG